MIVNRDIDLAGKIRIVWQMSNGESVLWKFNEEPTTQQLEELETKHLDVHLYDNVPSIKNILIDKNLIIDFIMQIREHPNVTFIQFNNWLSLKPWNEQVKIRNFIYDLSVELAQRNDLILTDYAEQQVLTNVRNWLVNTPIRKISKIIFDYEEVII